MREAQIAVVHGRFETAVMAAGHEADRSHIRRSPYGCQGIEAGTAVTRDAGDRICAVQPLVR